MRAMLSGPPETASTAEEYGSMAENALRSAASPIIAGTAGHPGTFKALLGTVRSFFLGLGPLHHRLRGLREAPLELSERFTGSRTLAEAPQRNSKLQQRLRGLLAVREIRKGLKKAVGRTSIFTAYKRGFSEPVLCASGERVVWILLQKLLEVGFRGGIFPAVERAIGLIEQSASRAA